MDTNTKPKVLPFTVFEAMVDAAILPISYTDFLDVVTEKTGVTRDCAARTLWNGVGHGTFKVEGPNSAMTVLFVG